VLLRLQIILYPGRLERQRQKKMICFGERIIYKLFAIGVTIQNQQRKEIEKGN
jgi:hypothetical protein